jgi:hypothetical protein
MILLVDWPRAKCGAASVHRMIDGRGSYKSEVQQTKNAETRWRASPPYARIVLGEGPGKTCTAKLVR